MILMHKRTTHCSIFYYSPALGELRLEVPATVRGGILADESKRSLVSGRHANAHIYAMYPRLTNNYVLFCLQWDLGRLFRLDDKILKNL